MDDHTLKLINSYVDGSISRGDMQKLQTLFDSDPRLAKEAQTLLRLRSLCLVDKSQAPADMSKLVLGRLKHDHRKHAHHHRHKFGMRRFFNVAAILLMVLVLGSVLLVIVGPFAASDGSGLRGVSADASDQAAQTFAAASEGFSKAAARPMMLTRSLEKPQDGLYSYSLDVSTKNIAKTERVLGQLFYEYDLLDGVNVSRKPGKTVYKIECSREGLDNLAQNMAPLWLAADDVSLEFADYVGQRHISVADITQQQLERIVTADDIDTKFEDAAVASAINSLPLIPMNSFEKGYEVPANLFTIRPVMAGARGAKSREIKRDNYITVSIKITAQD